MLHVDISVYLTIPSVLDLCLLFYFHYDDLIMKEKKTAVFVPTRTKLTEFW